MGNQQLIIAIDIIDIIDR